jgi:hypothetical protein
MQYSTKRDNLPEWLRERERERESGPSNIGKWAIVFTAFLTGKPDFRGSVGCRVARRSVIRWISGSTAGGPLKDGYAGHLPRSYRVDL